MSRFFIFLVFLVSGCYSPGESDDDMILKPLQWGQTRQIKTGEWQQNRPLTVVEKAAEYSGDEVHVSGVKNPFVKNLTLGVNLAPAMGGQFALRWLITFGVGGGSEQFLVDANDLQQMALSADMLRASIVSAYPGITDATGAPLGNAFTYSNPTKDVFASAFYAEGMTSTDPPTYTQRFDLSVLTSVTVPLPKFASTFRVLGDPATTSPFVATMVYSLIDPVGTVLDSYTGDHVFDVRLAPVPTGIAYSLIINNTSGANAATGSIEWGLDL